MFPMMKQIAEKMQHSAELDSQRQKLRELQSLYEKTNRILNACTEDQQEKITRNQEKKLKTAQEISEIEKRIAELEELMSETKEETVLEESVIEPEILEEQSGQELKTVINDDSTEITNDPQVLDDTEAGEFA